MQNPSTNSRRKVGISINLRDLESKDLERTVWRYMPFSKFISLMTYQALWFSKLNILQDSYEGLIPATVKQRMHEQNQRHKLQYNSSELHRQIDAWPTQNEEDGRELLVVTCWFLGESESLRMWEEYGLSNEAVAVKSTIGQLAKYILVPKDETVSHLGLVSYVAHDAHEMSNYQAHQAIERAFLKDKAHFSHEQEVRLVTLNIKTANCASPEGKAYTFEQVAGANMNNFENPGLYVGVYLNSLISEVVLCPSAEEWFAKLVCRIAELSGLSAPVSRSRLQNA